VVVWFITLISCCLGTGAHLTDGVCIVPFRRLCFPLVEREGSRVHALWVKICITCFLRCIFFPPPPSEGYNGFQISFMCAFSSIQLDLSESHF
jgi:hypothetical protein